jgi:hypothetical protein
MVETCRSVVRLMIKLFVHLLVISVFVKICSLDVLSRIVCSIINSCPVISLFVYTLYSSNTVKVFKISTRNNFIEPSNDQW